MAEALKNPIAFVGIDIGKNSFHVVGLDERVDVTTSLISIGDLAIPFDPTGEKIKRDGSWCVHQFGQQLDAMMFWDRFQGRWLRGEESFYPERPTTCERRIPHRLYFLRDSLYSSG